MYFFPPAVIAGYWLLNRPFIDNISLTKREFRFWRLSAVENHLNGTLILNVTFDVAWKFLDWPEKAPADSGACISCTSTEYVRKVSTFFYTLRLVGISSSSSSHQYSWSEFLLELWRRSPCGKQFCHMDGYMTFRRPLASQSQLGKLRFG